MILPYYPKEVIEKAKEMDLLTYLQNYEPDELVHFSRDTYCTKEHDSLKISNGLWCWNSRSIGGKSAVKYLTDVKGYSQSKLSLKKKNCNHLLKRLHLKRNGYIT